MPPFKHYSGAVDVSDKNDEQADESKPVFEKIILAGIIFIAVSLLCYIFYKLVFKTWFRKVFRVQ